MSAISWGGTVGPWIILTDTSGNPQIVGGYYEIANTVIDWSAICEVPAMVKAIRTRFNPNSTMADLADADQVLRDILARIDGITT